MTLLEVREPVVGHELDPERGEDIEERRLLVVAGGVGRGPGQAVSLEAPVGLRLSAREEPPADHLWIRLEEAQPIAVPIAGELVLAEVRERDLELHVASERL